MTILGSGELVRSLAAQRLDDGLQVMTYLVAIGAGTPLFAGLTRRLDFALRDH